MNILASLNIKKEEGQPILLLVGYSFFMGLSIAFFFTATISDFLTHFDIEVLPYTYILSGVLGYGLWWFWSKLEKRVGFPIRLRLGISFLFITVAVLCTILLFTNNPWVSFAMLVWVRVFIFVNMVNFWGMAGKLFNLSQGKRLFGIISTGSVISDIVGFFSIPLILLLGFNNTGLVFLSLAALLICLLITVVISGKFKDKLKESFSSRRQMLDKDHNQPFFKSRYHLFLFSLAILPMFGFYFVDYLFLDQIQLQYQNSPTALAGFMGIFFGVVAVFELVIKTSVFSKLIYNFGLKLALLVLPAVLLLTVALTIFLGVVAGSFGFLFSMIAFIKLLEKILRSGVNDPSFQILYQPIPSGERLAFQSKMEGVPTALGNTTAGILLLIMIPLGLTEPLVYNIIFLLVLILWTYLAYKMQEEYRAKIMNETGRFVDANLSDSIETDWRTRLSNFLLSVNGDNAMRALLIFQYLDVNQWASQLRKVMGTGSNEVRQRAHYLADQYEISLDTPGGTASNNADQIDASSTVAKNDLLLAASTKEKISLIRKMAVTGNLTDKREVVETMLGDTDHRVISALLEIIPSPLDANFGHLIIDNLEDVSLFHLVTPLLRKREKSIAHLIIKKMQQMEAGQISDLEQRILFVHLMDILDDQKSDESIDYFVKLLNHGNKEVRTRALRSLEASESNQLVDYKEAFEQKVEHEVAFSSWLLASMRDLELDRDRMDNILDILRLEFSSTQDRIFSFLTFLYPRDVIVKIRENLKSGQTDKNILATEMCDLLFDQTMKPLLMPIFSNIPTEEKAKALNKEFPQETLSPMDRLKDISYQDFSRVNTWLRILAMQKLAMYSEKIPKEILANLHIPDPFVKETAYCVAFQIDSNLAWKKLNKETKDFQRKMEGLLGTDPRLGKTDSIFDKVQKLKRCSLFSSLDEDILLKLALQLVRVDLADSRLYSTGYQHTEYVHLVVNGVVQLQNRNGATEEIHPNELFGVFEPIDLRKTPFKSGKGAEVLAIEGRRFYQLVAIYDELSNAILSAYFIEEEIEA